MSDQTDEKSAAIDSSKFRFLHTIGMGGEQPSIRAARTVLSIVAEGPNSTAKLGQTEDGENVS